jgi:hypothetical protein
VVRVLPTQFRPSQHPGRSCLSPGRADSQPGRCLDLHVCDPGGGRELCPFRRPARDA